MKPTCPKALTPFFTIFLSCLLLAACLPFAAPFATYAAYAADEPDRGSGSSAKADEAQKSVAYSGRGSSSNPIKIADAQGLVDFARDYNANAFDNKIDLYIVLTENIDLAGVSWEPIGLSSERPFFSNFDGQGHRISGLLINALPEGGGGPYYPYGVFGYVAQGSIRHLQVEGDIRLNSGGAGSTGSSGSGVACVGMLVGIILPPDRATVVIDGCSTRGTLSVKNGDFYAGGMVGYIASSGADQTITLSESDSSVTIAAGDAPAISRIGGLVGFVDADSKNTSLSIKDCEASGSITVSQATVAANNDLAANAAPTAPPAASIDSTGVVTETGGLLGSLHIGKDSVNAAFKNNTVSGKIVAVGDMPYNSTGGMIGFLQVSNGAFSAVSCTVTIEIEASGQSDSVLTSDVPSGSGTESGGTSGNGSGNGAAPNTSTDGNSGGGSSSGGSATSTSSTTAIASVTISPPSPRTAVGGLFGSLSVEKGTVGLSSSSVSGRAASKGAMVMNDCGGLIGFAQARENATLAIAGSSASGVFEASGTEINASGGLIGQAAITKASSLTVTTSHARGSAITHNGSECCSGGLIGNVGFSEESKLSVTRCSAATDVLAGIDPSANTGIFGIFDKPASRIYTDYKVGGLFGCITGSESASGVIASCFAKGDAVVQDSQETCAGGFAGSIYAGKGSRIALEDCYALGNTSASGEATYHDAGGLVGYAFADTGEILIDTCYATGKVTISGEAYRNSAGGIMGRADVVGIDADAAEADVDADAADAADAEAPDVEADGADEAEAEAVGAEADAPEAEADADAADADALDTDAPDADADAPDNDAPDAGAAEAPDAVAPDMPVHAGTLTLRNAVAANAQIDALDATNNAAQRIIGYTSRATRGTLSLEENRTWSELSVNGLFMIDSEENGKGIAKSYLLNRSFWETTQQGTGFAKSETWKAQDGSLPLLTYPSGNAYAPDHLITRTVAQASEAHNANVSSIVLTLLNCAFVALVIIGFIRLKRSLQEEDRETV